jgi:hypothetical protein
MRRRALLRLARRVWRRASLWVGNVVLYAYGVALANAVSPWLGAAGLLYGLVYVALRVWKVRRGEGPSVARPVAVEPLGVRVAVAALQERRAPMGEAAPWPLGQVVERPALSGDWRRPVKW